MSNFSNINWAGASYNGGKMRLYSAGGGGAEHGIFLEDNTAAYPVSGIQLRSDANSVFLQTGLAATPNPNCGIYLQDFAPAGYYGVQISSSSNGINLIADTGISLFSAGGIDLQSPSNAVNLIGRTITLTDNAPATFGNVLITSVSNAINISNTTNSLNFGYLSGITMTTTMGDIQINNSSGGTFLSNSADVINLTTTSNDINITSGNDINLSASNNAVITASCSSGTPSSSGSGFFAGVVSLVDTSPAFPPPTMLPYPVGVNIESLSNGIGVLAGGGITLYDTSPAGVGGIGIYSSSNGVFIEGAGGSGTRLQDSAPAGFGVVQIQSFSNDVNIISSNVGGGVNLSAVGTAGNITLSTNGSVTGVVISNISNGGVGTLTVDSANHLYWNGTFIA